LSQQNVDLVRAAYEAFGRGEIPAVFDTMDDDVQFVIAENSTYYRGTPYAGKPDIAANIFGRIGVEWDGFTIAIEQLHDAGDAVVMQGRYRGTYKATGRQANIQVVHIWTVRNGKLVRMQQYADTAGMREVTGQSASAAASSKL
jgi:ketosteroid isomerase-like protein